MNTFYVIDDPHYVISNQIDLYQHPITFTGKIKNISIKTKNKTLNFLKKPETKIASLVGYWAAETVFTVAAIYAFLTLHLYIPAATALFLIAYLTYATFGVIGEATK